MSDYCWRFIPSYSRMFRDTQDFSSFWSELTQLGSCGWFTFVGAGVFDSRRVPEAEGRIERKMDPGDSRGDLSMSIDCGGGVLLASVSGRFTLNRGVEVFKAVCDTALAKGFEKILIDCGGMSGEIPNRDRYEFGKEVAAHCIRMSLKIALLGEEPVITGVGIVTAQNRGLQVQLFSERQRALEWLARS